MTSVIMDILDLNNIMVGLLTKEREDETYMSIVKNLLNQYKEVLSTFDYDKYGLDPITINEEIDDICNTVISCIEFYNKGCIAESITLMCDILNKYFMKWTSLIIDKEGEYKDWYRIRPQEDMIRLYEAHEMFHIPFEKRYKIKNQRFSISGYPCLYLGKSVWGCWEEMHEIDLRNACVSRFEVQNKIRLLNVCLPINELVKQTTQDIGNLLRTYPLIISCSIRVLKPQEPFKPEYIIPQLLMLAVKQTEVFEGCAYTSTHSNEYFGWDTFLLTNIAMPVKIVKEQGLCSTLCSYFKVTDSDKEEYLRLKGEVNENNNQSSRPVYHEETECLEFLKPKEGYKASPFYFVEKKLKQKEAKQLL